MTDNASDGLEIFISAIMFAVAVTVLVIALGTLSTGITLSSKNIDEKQSIGTAAQVDIDTTPANRTQITYTRAQVYSAIVALDAGVVAAYVDGTDVPAEWIEGAQSGDERCIKKIRQMLAGHKYEEADTFEHDDEAGDRLCRIDWRMVS